MPKTTRRRTSAEKEEAHKVIAEARYLRRLLKEFGATLVSFDPGATARLPGNPRGTGYWHESLSFSEAEWKWLEPLLQELLFYRLYVRHFTPKQLKRKA